MALIRTNVLEEGIVCIVRVERISKLGTASHTASHPGRLLASVTAVKT
jgi:hypothetical protein